MSFSILLCLRAKRTGASKLPPMACSVCDGCGWLTPDQVARVAAITGTIFAQRGFVHIGPIPLVSDRVCVERKGREPPAVFSENFLKDKSGVHLEPDEHHRLEAGFSEIKRLRGRETLVRAGKSLHHSTLLLNGFMCRYIDDRRGLRQLVAVHVPGDFVDLHAYPLKSLDHDVATLTAATVAIVPHAHLDELLHTCPNLARKLWFATLVDAAIHRAWLFRLGRLDAVGCVAHFLCEMNARLRAVALSDGRQFEFPITQVDVGEICGLSNVHVNRVMRHLREERLCVFRSSLVEIVDPERLATRAQFDPSYLYIKGEAFSHEHQASRQTS